MNPPSAAAKPRSPCPCPEDRVCSAEAWLSQWRGRACGCHPGMTGVVPIALLEVPAPLCNDTPFDWTSVCLLLPSGPQHQAWGCRRPLPGRELPQLRCLTRGQPGLPLTGRGPSAKAALPPHCPQRAPWGWVRCRWKQRSPGRSPSEGVRVPLRDLGDCLHLPKGPQPPACLAADHRGSHWARALWGGVLKRVTVRFYGS